jgi:hypothetical protein
MAGKRMPELRDTGRRYLGETQRARLASPGLERYRSARRSGPAVLLAAAILALLLVGGLVWLSYGR